MSPLPQNSQAGSPDAPSTPTPTAQTPKPAVLGTTSPSTASHLSSSPVPTSSSTAGLVKPNSKSNQSFLIAIIVVVSLLVVAVIAFTFWRRSKKSKATHSSSRSKPNSLQRNHPSSSSQQTTSQYSSLTPSSTRGLLGSIKEEEGGGGGSKEYLSDVDMQQNRSGTGSFEEEVRWATPNQLENQGYANEIRRWDEGEGVVLGEVEYNYGQTPARGKGRGRGEERSGRREELPPSFEDARRGGAGRGVYEVLEDRKMLIPERG